MSGSILIFGLFIALIFVISIVLSSLFCRVNLYAHKNYGVLKAKVIKYVSHFVIALLLLVMSAAPGFLLSVLTDKEIPHESAFAISLVINLIGAHLGSRKYINKLKDIGL